MQKVIEKQLKKQVPFTVYHSLPFALCSLILYPCLPR